MYKTWLSFIIFFIAIVLAKEPELPLCPPHIQYFPQSLPMHCRMPSSSDFNFPTMPPFSPNFQQGKLPETMPFPGLPRAPPGSMPIPMPMPMPIPPVPPMPPMHPMPQPGHKLPVVVMPLYSQDTSYKKKKDKKHKRPHHITDDSSDTDTSTDDSSDTSSDDKGWWRRSNKIKKAHHHRHPKRITHRKRQELITPVLQYVTKEGYVIYEKEISKGEAKDWLHMQHDGQNEGRRVEETEHDSDEARDETNDNNIRIDKAKSEMKSENNLRRHQKKPLKNIPKKR